MPTKLIQKQIIINNLLVNYYYKAGKQGAPILLFLHGWRSEGKVWQFVMKEMPKDYNIYSIDFPGFGSSDAPKKDFKVGDYVKIVDAFIKKMELQDVVIAGHSFGGRVGIKLASNNPEYLQKLVVANSAGIRQKSASREVKKKIAKLVKPIFALSFLKPLRRKIYESMGADDYLATPQLKQTFVNIVNEDLTPLLEKIKKPTLLIWGDQDEETPLGYARIMEQKIPEAKLVIFKGAGHFSFLDRRDDFIKEIIEFIK